MFSHFFIRRPIFAGVISIVMILIGGFSLLSLPVARYPDIAPPTINVTATFPGADAKTVADIIGAPIEAEVNGVENMLYMQSVSGNDGTYMLTITFESGTDLDMANVLVQNRISAAIPKLPQETQRIGVRVKKRSSDANLYAVLYSPDERFDGLFLSNYLSLNVQDEIARSPGVGEVSSFGVGDYSMRIWLDPEQMQVRQLTPGDVINAIRDQNVQAAAGAIGDPPMPDGQAFTLTMNVQGRLVDVEEFENIVIRADADGRVLRLKDVARVELGSSLYRITASYKGQDAATIVVYQIPGANAIEVVEGVRERLEELKKDFPEGLDYEIVFDNTDVIRASIRSVVVNLFATLALVIFTVYIFLQNFRATIIPSITIPVSLVGTFIALSALGYSINQFTLFGLVLVIGIVVDDAIVVVENCSRLIDEGLDPKAAAMQSMTEVSGPVIATTLVLLAVFVPTAFMGGITGTLFQQFAITISVATVFSSVNALTLSPALCGILLRPTPPGHTAKGFGWFNRVLDRTRSRYEGGVGFLLRRYGLGLAMFAALVALSVFGFIRLPTGFVPQEDEGYCLVNLQLPDAASQERMLAFTREAEEVIKSVPGVKDFLVVTGFSIMDSVAIPNAGFAVVVFDLWGERGPDKSQDVIIGTLNQRLSGLLDGVARAFPVPSLPGLGLVGGFSMMVQDRGGVGTEALQVAAQELIEAGNGQQAITGMYTPSRSAVPQLRAVVDREQVLAKGLPLNAVFQALQTHFGSSYINDFTLYNRTFEVRAQAEGAFRTQPEDVLNVQVRHPSGRMLPLGAVLSVEHVTGPQNVIRYNMYPSLKVMGSASEGFSSGDALTLLEDMSARLLPASIGYEWTGLSLQEKMAQAGTAIIFLLAIVLVYLVLAAQYESWSLPVSVILAVPTALLGAVIGVLARNYDNNVYMQVGLVLLIGLCTKSAILIVEFAKEQMEKGRNPEQAAMDAAKLRFRAVLMTAFSFIFGVIPLMVSTGAGAISQRVIGTTVFAGMMVATVISLLLVPMLFMVVARLTGTRRNEE
jgi:hydrophobic/amphiphilic exporter-1 (mainly G- bacteria), HAE1 family